MDFLGNAARLTGGLAAVRLIFAAPAKTRFSCKKLLVWLVSQPLR
jgi:hypothetical protein